ncbi:hypothetical protein AMJ80_07110 [bacterium SM23_31]|nr:MAG: hypothetical protein AMJ80_07110 [bacterium SM23_31]
MKFQLTIFFKNLWALKKTIIILITLSALIALGVYLGLDAKIIVLVTGLFAIITNAFFEVLAIIALVPILGPLIVKVLTLPIFWIINGIGYLASIVAIKKGHGMEVITYRLLTIVFLIGIIFGYVLCKLLP